MQQEQGGLKDIDYILMGLAALLIVSMGSGGIYGDGSVSTNKPEEVLTVNTETYAEGNPTYRDSITVGVEKRSHCRKLDEHFKQRNLKLELIQIVFRGEDGGDLLWVCHFKGPQSGDIDVRANEIFTRSHWTDRLRRTGKL